MTENTRQGGRGTRHKTQDTHHRYSTTPHKQQEENTSNRRGHQHTDGRDNITHPALHSPCHPPTQQTGIPTQQTGIPITLPPFHRNTTHHHNTHPTPPYMPPTTTMKGEDSRRRGGGQTVDTPPHKHHTRTHATPHHTPRQHDSTQHDAVLTRHTPDKPGHRPHTPLDQDRTAAHTTAIQQDTRTRMDTIHCLTSHSSRSHNQQPTINMINDDQR